jgi:hypothetical protein
MPDTRDFLHWSYSAAGFMTTINAAGYLAGVVLGMARLVAGFGAAASFVEGGAARRPDRQSHAPSGRVSC